MCVNVFACLVVCPMHLNLNCDAVNVQSPGVSISQVKRRLHYMRKCVSMFNCLSDALEYEDRFTMKIVYSTS